MISPSSDIFRQKTLDFPFASTVNCTGLFYSLMAQFLGAQPPAEPVGSPGSDFYKAATKGTPPEHRVAHHRSTSGRAPGSVRQARSVAFLQGGQNSSPCSGRGCLHGTSACSAYGLAPSAVLLTGCTHGYHQGYE